MQIETTRGCFRTSDRTPRPVYLVALPGSPRSPPRRPPALLSGRPVRRAVRSAILRSPERGHTCPHAKPVPIGRIDRVSRLTMADSFRLGLSQIRPLRVLKYAITFISKRTYCEQRTDSVH